MSTRIVCLKNSRIKKARNRLYKMPFGHKTDMQKFASDEGTYLCSSCAQPLFEGDKRFEAHCGFPSFWLHVAEGVELKPLTSYGRIRTQVVCSGCSKHLGHLFEHPDTPTQLRYCINQEALKYVKG
ncbi:peptide-methionine (R)-S-oxide reductase [Pedobacter sp. SYSU D00535]|uniref:peptide-methionine (R)-S-oxide reductase n=1 Tax=Pedobacter sp. SYSU D00535 TaxID=2810308 RepID=UPI00351BD9CD